MFTKKNYLSLFGLLVLTFGVAACGGTSETSKKTESTSKVTVQPSTTPSVQPSTGGQTTTVDVATPEALKEALAAEGGLVNIKLTDNVTIAEQLDITKKVTLDLDGHTINNTTDIWTNTEDSKTWSLISVKEGGDLTINNGTFAAKEKDCYAIDVRGGNLTINDGTFVGNIHAVYVYEGTCTINGGNFSIQQLNTTPGKEYDFVLNCYDANYQNGTAKIIVTGGTFANFDPSNCGAEGSNTNFVAEGYEVTKDGDNYTVSKKSA